MKTFFKITLSIVIMIAGCVLVAISLKRCEGIDVDQMNKRDSLEIQNTLLKLKISQHENKYDSILKAKVKNDSIQIVYKYKYLKSKDSFSNIEQMPCDSVKKEVPKLISACDSVIHQDSLIKEDYKRALAVSDSIKSNYKQIVSNDSSIIGEQDKKIATLEKKVRRKTVEARVSQGVGLIGWILAFLK